ncbi:PAS domain-containing protein [Flavobacterium sp.]|jgi:PAS domain S-box-containing protein|uniref:PAS domain-containing sensor histidine kinase n=1 Tax=Flavobacterium sp. TaxID=239 RepID=UPI0037BE9450
MKKSALQYTLFLISIPTTLVIISHYILIQYKHLPNYGLFYFIKDIVIIFISSLVAYVVILKNNKRNLKKNERIRLSNERYDIVAKATSDTIWDWDLTTDHFTWNKGIQGIFGYKKGDVGKTSKWFFDKIHPNDSLKMSVKMYSYAENKIERWQENYSFMCADGSVKHVLDRGFLVINEKGIPVRMIGAMQDITKQRVEELRLKLLETVILQSKNAIAITEANETKATIPTIVYVNPAFTTITGFNPKDILGKPATEYFNRNSVKNNLNKLSQALKNKQEYKFESHNVRKNGEQYWLNITLLPISNIEGEHSHWISIQREITLEKEREKEREQLINELTQNNKDLKQFSYITSHNLRAPLSNLTGLLDLLNDIPIENKALKEILNGFSSSTKMLNDTINDLAKVIVIKDSLSIAKEKLIIGDILTSTLHQLTNIISLNKPEIKLSLDKAPEIYANKTFFESILLNLLTNALKYKAKDKQLKIAISSKELNNKIILTFCDNGIGIDLKRNKDKVFGLYQRFHDYPDSKGLGLYLVKSQVESMGGKIEIESEVNLGTTFTLTFNKEEND